MHTHPRDPEATTKFGIFFLLEQPEWKSQARVYADAIAQAAHAEELADDACWPAQHHFSEHGTCPSMPVLAGALARRTSGIRRGTAVPPHLGCFAQNAHAEARTLAHAFADPVGHRRRSQSGVPRGTPIVSGR